MSKEDFYKIKSYCDECADKSLKDNTNPEELYELAIRSKIDVTLDKIKESIERGKEKARNYKNNINTDMTFISYYTLTKNIDNEVYVSHRFFLDEYIRLNNYPVGIFKSPEEIINMCESDSWKFAYWNDENTGEIVRAYNNIEEAKKRIRKMFNDYSNIVVEFG